MRKWSRDVLEFSAGDLPTVYWDERESVDWPVRVSMVDPIGSTDLRFDSRFTYGQWLAKLADDYAAHYGPLPPAPDPAELFAAGGDRRAPLTFGGGDQVAP